MSCYPVSMPRRWPLGTATRPGRRFGRRWRIARRRGAGHAERIQLEIVQNGRHRAGATRPRRRDDEHEQAAEKSVGDHDSRVTAAGRTDVQRVAVHSLRLVCPRSRRGGAGGPVGAGAVGAAGPADRPTSLRSDERSRSPESVFTFPGFGVQLHRNAQKIRLLVTLKNLARPHAPGLTLRAILETFTTLQMVDVHLPTTDGRQLVLPRHTRPNREHDLLLHQLKLQLPTQPAPRITA